VYLIKNICEIVSGSFIQFSKNDKVSELSYDSRKIQSSEKTLFFALKTAHADGHLFVEDAYQKGVRNFCVAQETDVAKFPESNIILVENTLKALQSLAAYHRSQFALPVIGITGSNGKTIVKEWLYQLLHEDYNIVRSPRSYNSQLGVPLSVWQINNQHTLGIFEAGISEVGEMQNLEEIIKPDIGVLTNIGEAHDAGFSSSEQKKQEKLKLFTYSDVVIGPYQWLSHQAKEAFAWGAATEAKLQVLTIERSLSNPQHTVAFAKMKDQKFVLNIPFADEASVQNALTCVCVLLYLNYDIETINQRLTRLHAIDMRLHFMHGINDCAIINDSYSADLTSFHIALAFLKQQNTGQRRKVILSDFFESGKTDEELYEAIADDLKQNKVAGVIAIGEKISSFLPKYLPDAIVVQTYPDTESFIKHFRSSGFHNETILIKGARKFEFERIAQLFEQKVHQTLLEINLNAIVHNLKQYRRLLHKNTRVMAMVKAFAYGSGGAPS
jgi:alanine racemase